MLWEVLLFLYCRKSELLGLLYISVVVRMNHHFFYVNRQKIHSRLFICAKKYIAINVYVNSNFILFCDPGVHI